MEINKLTASFGKLENESLKLHSGLNVIYAPNESGKSTWCAFIQAMLYGIPSSERAKAGYLPDKTRYAPWSGAPMEGSMELTVDRKEITLNRSTRAKNAPMREFSAVHTGTNVPVEGLNGSNAGEMLTGVSRDVFRRSAFIAQGAISVSGSPELEKRINAIVSTGEEESSYSEADQRLRAWQRQRRYNRHGLLPELESKMDDTQDTLRQLETAVSETEILENRLRSLKQECAQLETAVTESRKFQRKVALDKLNNSRSNLKNCSEAHDACMAALSVKREELRSSPFGRLSCQELEEQVDQDMKALSGLKKPVKNLNLVLPALICFVLAAVFAGIFAASREIIFVILAAALCAGSTVLFLGYSKARHLSAEAQDMQRQILKKYGAYEPDDIIQLVEKHTNLWDEVQQAEQRERLSRTEYERARALQQELEESAMSELDFSSGSSEAVTLSRQLSAKRNEAQQLSARLNTLNGMLMVTGDPMVLSSELKCMQEQHDDISAEYDAISLAIQVLQEADADIQSRFSPKLGKLAAQYMSQVTGGRYEDVLLNRDFSALARTQGDVVARNAEYLSAGTLDLMYLAVRLAVCELALPEGENCPLIIDDALVNLDEERTAQALELLRRIAKKRQVIVFSCKKLV